MATQENIIEINKEDMLPMRSLVSNSESFLGDGFNFFRRSDEYKKCYDWNCNKFTNKQTDDFDLDEPEDVGLFDIEDSPLSINLDVFDVGIMQANPSPHKIQDSYDLEKLDLQRPYISRLRSMVDEDPELFEKNSETKEQKELKENNQQNKALQIPPVRSRKINYALFDLESEEDLQQNKILKNNGKKTGQRDQTLQEKQQKDETKNTVKNFGKGIIIFVNKQKDLVERLLASINSMFTHKTLIDELTLVKRSITKICHLQNLWTSKVYGKEMRIISNYFLRKQSRHWIFNSRIEKYQSPLKYRIRLLEGILKPLEFGNLKW